jgi:hypothetical protein
MIVVGLGWAALGLLNFLSAFRSVGAEHTGLAAFALVFNVLLFILPGLVVAGIGEILRRRGQHSSDDRSHTDERKCPQCAEWIKADAKKCRYCAFDIAAATMPGAKAPELTCQSCGSSFSRYSAHCPSCFADRAESV